jgi:hypothetical protein
MKICRNILSRLVVGAAALALAGSASRTQAATIISNTFTFTFDNGGATSPFNSTWIYWYNSPGGNSPILCDPTTDASNPIAGANTSGSGSLMVVSPLAGYTQNVFFGTFASNKYNAYDFSVEANMLLYSNISFDILVASNTPLSGAGNFGSIGVGIINSTSYGYQQFGSVTIPASASNSWFHASVLVDKAQDNLTTVPGIALDINSYGGYPLFTITNWIDNISANAPPAPPPPPPTLSPPQPAVVGLNCIFTTGGPNGANNRYQVATPSDSGYSWVGSPSVTYSWTITAFPTNTAYSTQQHFFIVNGEPGQYDQAADYNLADCIFLTVQADNHGGGVCNFRYKTNEAGGNGMLFNTLSPTNAANTNFWPVMPIASLDNPSAILGTWSLTFANTTNVTITAPGGLSTNFNMDPVSAALFVDPVTLLLGAQPNGNNYGSEVVLGNFSVTGNAAPFSDDFLTDTSLNPTYWKNLSNDTNGLVEVPPGSKFWVGWSLPATGFGLQVAPQLLSSNIQWVSLASLLTIRDNGQLMSLIATNNLPGTNQNYFTVVEHVFTQLQVLLPGETNAPNTPTGKTGTPNPVSLSTDNGLINCTVLAVDNHWNPIPGVTDTINITDSGGGVDPNNAALVNGSGVFTVYYGSTASGVTITATDVTTPAILPNTSSQFNVVP